MKSSLKFNREIIYALLVIALIPLVVGLFKYPPNPYFVVAVVIILISIVFNLIVYFYPPKVDEIKIFLIHELLNCQEKLSNLDSIIVSDIQDEIILDEIKKQRQDLSHKMLIIENQIKKLDIIIAHEKNTSDFN